MKTFTTRGTCSRAIEYEVTDGVITDCRFVGGCMGNTQGVAALVKGMKVEEAPQGHSVRHARHVLPGSARPRAGAVPGRERVSFRSRQIKSTECNDIPCFFDL